jgi:mono/diheme cytochrome c family protein
MQRKTHWSEWLLGSTALVFALVLVGAQYAPPALAAGPPPGVTLPTVDAGLGDGLAVYGLAADTALGRRIFVAKGNCFTCHGANARGTPLAPDLTDAEVLHVDTGIASIVGVVKEGVAKPVKYPAPMPPMGGASLSDAEIAAVAAWVHSLRPR